jgi:hypothetical protein
VIPARMRNRLSAVCMLVLPAPASLARRLRLAPRKDPQAVSVLTAGPANPLRKASPAAPRKLVQASPPPGRRLLGKTPRPSAPGRESPQLSTSGKFWASRYLPDVSGGLRADYDSDSSAFSVPKTTKTGIAGLVVRANDGTLDPDRIHTGWPP